VKKMYLTLPLFALIVACGGGNEKKEATAEVVDLSSNPDYQKGLELIGKSDCLTCHKVSDKNIGPAYKDVAAGTYKGEFQPNGAYVYEAVGIDYADKKVYTKGTSVLLR